MILGEKMKKITKAMPIIQAVWIYMSVAIFFGKASEQNMDGIFFWFLLAISIIINIMTIISARIEKDEFKKLAFINMMLKIVLIPFYALIFFMGFGFTAILSITGIGIFLAPIIFLVLGIIDYIVLLTTSSFGTSAIRIIRKKNVCPDKSFIGIQICHYLFVLDVIASVVLYIKVRRVEDTEEDVQFRKKVHKVLVVLSIILIVIIACYAYDCWAGEFGHTYYRSDTDYDDIVMQNLISNKYHSWNVTFNC